MKHPDSKKPLTSITWIEWLPRHPCEHCMFVGTPEELDHHRREKHPAPTPSQGPYR